MNELIPQRSGCRRIDTKHTAQPIKSSRPGRKITLWVSQPLSDGWTKGLVDFRFDGKNAKPALVTNDSHEVCLAWPLTVTKIDRTLKEGIQQCAIAKHGIVAQRSLYGRRQRVRSKPEVDHRFG